MFGENDCGNDTFAMEVEAPMLVRTADDTVLDLIDYWNKVGILDQGDIDTLFKTRDRLNMLLSAATGRRAA